MDNIEYEFVDLGLSVKWATCNIGATKPEEAGLYFQWGDTQGWTAKQVANGKKVFDWEHYKWCDGTSSVMTKYNVTDGKTVLDPEDDAAHVHIGGDWRMPTYEEIAELINACNTEWVTNYNGTGINGRLLTLKTAPSKTLFFPASGYLDGGSRNNAGSHCYYWSSSIYSSNPKYGWYLYSYYSFCDVTINYRYYGRPVRPVLPK